MKITNNDLYKQQFTEDVLLDNFDHLNTKIILHTQKLTPKFCIENILCLDDIDNGDEDSYLFDIPYILNKQPHIKPEELKKLFINNNKFNLQT